MAAGAAKSGAVRNPSTLISPEIMRVLPVSEQTLRIRRELSWRPRAILSGEQAKAQVKEHLSSAKNHLLKAGHKSGKL